MKPTLRRQFIEWICRVFGHRDKFSHFYAGSRHYICKRCGAHTSVSLSRQEMFILELILKQADEVEENEQS